jgi:protein phosphatase
VVIFIVVLVAILGAAAIAVGVYARGTYFVGLDGQRVAVFKGRPGGLLWFKPTVDHHTGHVVGDLVPQAQEQVRVQKPEPSRSAADAYVIRNLVPPPTTTTSTVPATTTTIAPSPSTTR